MCSDQEAVDLVRNIQDPVAAAKLLVEHALSRFSTDNLSCMVVRFEKEATIQSQNNRDRGVESENGSAKVSEVDKLVSETKQKIADGSAPAVGVSPSNSGRGHDPIPVGEEEFIPTTLDGAVLEEEPSAISDEEEEEEEEEDKPEESDKAKQPALDTEAKNKDTLKPKTEKEEAAEKTKES